MVYCIFREWLNGKAVSWGLLVGSDGAFAGHGIVE